MIGLFWAEDGTIERKMLLGVSGLIVAFIVFVYTNRTEELVDVPVMRGYGKEHERAMMEGALKYPTTPFVVETQRPFVILPPNCYEEIKNLSQDKATFWEIQKKELGAEFTGIFQHNPQLALALRADLNRNLPDTINQVEDKVSWVLEKELGNPQDWKSYNLQNFITLVVARMVSGVFVAPRFTRDDVWTDLSLRLTNELLQGRDAIKSWPTFLQPIVGPFLPDIRKANETILSMAELLKPVITSTLLENGATRPFYDEKSQVVDLGDDKDPEGQDGGSFVSWILKRLGTTDSLLLARAQVSLSFASINTTTNALTYIILDLATRSEYIQPLRDEIEEIIAEDNTKEDKNGVLRFKQTSLAKLWKLDSFMKESSRLSKNSITALRQVMKPITLSTGHRLPRGTRFALGARAVQMSPQSQTFSSEYNPPENKSPHEFDGFRFYRLRKMAGKENKHLFVTVSPDSLTWGYGRNACPGRFFADAEVKIILIELLRKWDLKVADPVKTNTQTVRKVRELFIVALKDTEVELRRRKVPKVEDGSRRPQ